jgi:hypothetical protein
VCVFNYLADCYGTYTSSAIAAQSFTRNILATGKFCVLPLLTAEILLKDFIGKHFRSLQRKVRMQRDSQSHVEITYEWAPTVYQALTYPWASSLLGFLAAILALVPFLLLKFGPELRDRSPFARQSLLD